MNPLYRVGMGYDSHILSNGLPLWLGGVKLPSDKGAQGHSDADVLLHALCDALLGSVAKGDIGQHFPNTEPRYKNISSSLLVKKVLTMLPSKTRLINMDAVVHLEKPKILKHVPHIRKHLSSLLSTDLNCLSVKAKTGEGMGTIGREEIIAAQVIVLVSVP